MTETIQDDELFEHNLHHFLEWLEVLVMQPKDACETWGNYNVAWELVNDLKLDGNAITANPYSYLTEDQKQEIINFLSSLVKIPESILVSATTPEANEEAMSHPYWKNYRLAAQKLIKILGSASKRNKEYFS